MKYRTLGKTGLKVSEIGFGTWALGGDAFRGYGPTDDAESLAALNKAYDIGCTFFDTADVYGFGKSEMLLGKALKGWERDRVIIATKCGEDFSEGDPERVRYNFSERHMRKAVEDSLKRLDIDVIDVYQLHNPSLELIQLGKMFEVLKALQTEGKIRFYGISINDPQEGIQATQIGNVQTIQAIYNLFDRRPDPALFASCEENNTGLIIREPFARGFLTGKFSLDPLPVFAPPDNRAAWPKPLVQKRVQAAEELKSAMPSEYPGLWAMALKYILAKPCVSTVIPGGKTPAQVMQNLSVSDLPDLEPSHEVAIGGALARIF